MAELKDYYEKIDKSQRKKALVIARTKGLEEWKKGRPKELDEIMELNYLIYKARNDASQIDLLQENHLKAVEQSIYDRLGRGEVL